MDNRNQVIFLSGLAAAATALCIAVSCSDQPKPKCNTGRGRFAALYTPLGAGPPDGGPCDLKGEAIGVETYSQANADGTNIDVSQGATVWIKGDSTSAASAGRGKAEDSTHPSSAIGQFVRPEPGSDDFRDIPSMAAAQQDLPGTDAGVPATSIKYEWKDVHVLVSSDSFGTQLASHLTYTRDGCTADYHVTAIYPFQECGVVGNPLDFCPCLPYADPDYKRPASPLNPALFGPPKFGPDACEVGEAQALALASASKVKCQKVTRNIGNGDGLNNTAIEVGLCVLKGDPPQ